jgi:hypothetical protein
MKACFIIISVRTMSVASNSNPSRITGQERKATGKNPSVLALCEIIVHQFDQLGNRTTLAESNFRMEDAAPKVPQETPKEDNIEASADESLSQADIEECPGDYDGRVVVNRIANDKLSKEISAPNSCAICLERYSYGEEVVWSANENCHHIYHKGCIAEYFAHAQTKGKQKCECPTCRQEYLVLSDNYRWRDKADHDSGLNVAVAASIAEARHDQVSGQRM